MYISFMRIKNYRTFKDVTLKFDSYANYIVGDNNIGKTNFLDLLKTITHGYGFRERDFMNPDEPIRILCDLSTMDVGVDDAIHLELSQKVREVVPKLYNRVNGEELPLEYMRSIFYIDFSLDDVPRHMSSDKEIRLLYTELSNFLTDNPGSIDEIGKILKERGLSVALKKEPQKAALTIIDWIYGLGGEENSADSESVVKLVTAVGAHLLGVLIKKRHSRAVPFENIILTNEKGEKFLPLCVSIDDPELHLHPYLQRAILAFLQMVLNNDDPLFVKLIKSFLGVDGLDGQLFVVTHSTDALVNDYRQIIRLHWNTEGDVRAACGSGFDFSREIEKHLIMHFPEVKEAMYARCAIIVEGETEYGSFPYFAKNLGVHLDAHGICLINARGESSISKISHLLKSFHIPTVCLYDRDVMGTEAHSPNVFFTDYVCFEMDVAETCIAHNRRNAIIEVAKDVDPDTTYVNVSLIKKACAKLNIPRHQYPPRKLENISARAKDAMKFYFFAWMYGNKGVITGRSLGMHLKKEDIPPAFARVIMKAVDMADHQPM